MWKDFQHVEWYKRGQSNGMTEKDKIKEREKALNMWGK